LSNEIEIAKVKALLTDYLALVERQYYAGDFGAVDRLIDLETAVSAAGLTARQRQALELTYYYGYNQREAGGKMGVGQRRAGYVIDEACAKIAAVYAGWERIDGGKL
jgi:DNA-directed RNA polymerase specialized sigma24 family protein